MDGENGLVGEELDSIIEKITTYKRHSALFETLFVLYENRNQFNKNQIALRNLTVTYRFNKCSVILKLPYSNSI